MTEGLTYEMHRYRDTNCHVLTVDLTKRTIRPIPVGPDYPAYQYYTETTRPPQLAQAAGALASVGSDYTSTKYSGVPLTAQPRGAFMLNGELWTSGQRNSPMLVLSQGWARITGEKLHVGAIRQDGTLWECEGGQNVKYRGRPTAYTPRIGAQPVGVEDVPGVLLIMDPTDHTKRVVSPTTPGNAVTPGAILVSGDTPLEMGEIVTWTRWDQGGAVVAQINAQHIIAGVPLILKKGQWTHPRLILQAPPGPDAPFIIKNPRTAIGVTGRTVYIVVAEGRTSENAGLRLKPLAHFMRTLGVQDALNLDGGGSSHMWTKEDGLVADSCYGTGTLEGTRPQAYATAVF